MHFLSTRLDEHRRVIDGNPQASLFLSERSPFTDKIFWKANIDTGRIPAKLDFIYLDLWRHWQRCVAPFEQPSYFLYLATPLEQCMQRIESRRRPEEDGIPADYLQALHDYHVAFFDAEHGALMPNGSRVPVVMLDGTCDFRDPVVARAMAAEIMSQINFEP